MRQKQFLEVVSHEEATRRLSQALGPLQPLGEESIALSEATGRVLARDLRSGIDVTGFDRALMDGFAVRASDTAGTDELNPRTLQMIGPPLSPGDVPPAAVTPGTCVAVATGAMIPRGADAVLMVEHTDVDERTGGIQVLHAVPPGQSIAFAGTDIARGQLVLTRGTVLSSREIGVAAALGLIVLPVFRRPRVAVLSTGNEIVAPGSGLPAGSIYDANAAILAAAVEECGGEAVRLGIVRDEPEPLRMVLAEALNCDVAILSGGTSKGEGDLCIGVVRELCDPGIVVHGVALKPGKPVCLAVHRGRPVFVLPGFPTSAVFTFHEFAAPVVRQLAGVPSRTVTTVPATLPVRWNSDRGRTEFALVHLLEGPQGRTAWPLGSGSGSVTTFSQADGFIRIDQHAEFVDAGTIVDVTLLSRHIRPADLVFVGSHCNRVEEILSEVRSRGFECRSIWVGSQSGLKAVADDQCDVSGMHLMDPQTGEYNRPFLRPGLSFVPGYSRAQGIVCRHNDPRCAPGNALETLRRMTADPDCRLVCRNSGSGTRLLIDRLLNGLRPPGYSVQPGSHNAVCAAVEQERADWGVAVEAVARQYDLQFLPLTDEQYDFVIPESRLQKPAVKAFLEVLRSGSGSFFGR